MGLLLWISGLIAGILIALMLYTARSNQTQEGNRESLRSNVDDAAAIIDLLADGSIRQRRVIMKYLSDPKDFESNFGFFAIDWVPERMRQLSTENLVQWVERGQRFSESGKSLGAAPAHWLAALVQERQTVIFSEPPNSTALTPLLNRFGAETLLIRIDSQHAIALISPRRLFSDPELWRYAGMGLLAVWLGLFLSLSILAAPIVYWIAKRQAQRIGTQLTSLSDSAEQWAVGETEVKTHVSNITELQGLTASFARMAGRWQATRLAESAALGSLEASIVKQRAFVADISHDLRTPLTAVLGYTERALRRASEDADLQIVAREAQALNRLVTNLFEIAQSDLSENPGANRLQLASASARALLEDLVNSFAPLAWARGVLLRVAPDAQEIDFAFDRDRLMMALRNLIDNAVQHTEEGGLVELGLRASVGQVIIMVTDTGAGIAPDLIPRIFERGVRGDDARTRRGGGLGLAITQHIVQQHQGHVEVTSVLGKGSQFRLIFPV